MTFFSYPLTVQASDIDALKHVNNEVYLRWLLQAASAHSVSLGYGMEKFLSDGACFVVRRHEIEYLASAYMGEELVVETWVKDMEAVRSKRAYRIRRIKDDKVLVTAETLWVYINMKTGRPIEIPASMQEAYLNSTN
jgi:acyl-CoA thioester hydrolase